jgi:type VI secretion system protein VasD
MSRRAAPRTISALLAGVIGAGVACNTVNVPKEPEKCTLQLVDLTIMASDRVNPAESGEPRPVQLRVYQLTTDVHLNNASFEQIWKADKATLGEDLVKVEEMSVYPDSRTDIRFERDPKALIVGAVALFRTPKGRTWYTTFELPPAPGKGDCTILEPNCEAGACKKDLVSRLNPHFYVWLDQSRVDDGEDRLEEFPTPGRRREFSFAAEKSTPQAQGDGGGSAP